MADVEEIPAEEAEPESGDPTAALLAQVATARRAFYRLAEVRAADLVKYEGKSWNEAGSYIEAEMHGLDQQLAACDQQLAACVPTATWERGRP